MATTDAEDKIRPDGKPGNWLQGLVLHRLRSFKAWNKTPAMPAILVPIVLGVVSFYVIVGPNVLDPRNIAWLSVGDPIQHYLGWCFFRDGPWDSPIGASPRYGLEFSNSIVYSDSIPLLAIPFKLISQFLPETFQYFGYWYLLCFVMMSLLGWKLASTITSNNTNRFFVAGLFIFSPPMLWRLYGHEALAAHFLIVTALYLSLRKNQEHRIVAWSTLVSVTALVHAYLLAMAFVLWIANLITESLRRDTRIANVVFETILTLVALSIVCWQAGYFTVGGNYDGGDTYGYYRANLLTFVDPGGFSYLLKDITRGGVGDFEGFAFPGLGVLVLLVTVIPTLHMGSGHLFRALKNNVALVVALLSLAAFALTNKMAIGPHVYEFPLPDLLKQYTGIFRAAGRMIWPAQYALTFLVVYLAITHQTSRNVTILLGFAFVVQVVDTHAGWKNLKPNFMNEPESSWETRLRSDFWRVAAQKYKKLAHFAPVNAMNNWNYFADYACKYHLPTDAAYFARVDSTKLKHAQDLSAEIIKSGKYDRDSLYVIDDDIVSQVLEHIINTADIVAKVDGFNVLAPGWGECSQCPKDLDELYLADGQVRIKSGGKKIENVSNGYFDEGTTHWRSGYSAKLSVVDGKLRVTNGANSAGHTKQTLWLTAGLPYLFRFTWIEGTAPFKSSAAIVVDGVATYLTPLNGVEYSHSFVAGSNNYIVFYVGDSVRGHYSDFDSVSVTEASK